MRRVIAIVEDDPAEADILKSHFARYSSACGEEFDIRWFQRGDVFLTGYQPIYDVVMMDIDLPGITGMAAAQQLRRMDRSVTLVFVTNLARYAAKGYAVDAMDFLLKPVSYPSFSGALQRALMRCRRSRRSDLLINTSDGVYRISTDRVKYIEVINHTLVYHTTEGVIHASGNLKDIESRLPAGQFVRCNRCYLVNLAFVRAVRGYRLVLDMDELQISRPKRTAVLEALNNYLGGGV
ncbi:MAG: LytTR family DNA-binding domain-containing protein [Oscillospiraceae bacterium]|nr:LytTR family DNA-binding domain-containing protein [Oscillospiraceae bacterium]